MVLTNLEKVQSNANLVSLVIIVQLLQLNQLTAHLVIIVKQKQLFPNNALTDAMDIRSDWSRQNNVPIAQLESTARMV